ncbi:Putative two-component membrane permease complex subunit SMU_747c [bacterium HR17]|uniref:Two-component membrane permease complex subunit SMU_747c n=1 Tax=Candidatus Fervidibacter japonicus TaxID=2035412 RepID=A0A2H5XAD7_9BACT|nr:Putative two-component membrane permease complex subunit SMU_747c [bacterium HR17]
MQPQPNIAQEMLADAVDIFQCCILTWDFLPVVLPAYLLAGAIAAFVPIDKVLRYLNLRARQWLAYLAGIFTGFIVSVCSCNIVPLGASIYRRGAGVGPAFAFLYAGPGLNLVALVWTFQVFGGVFGLWRLGGAIVTSLVIGIVMALLFRSEQTRAAQPALATDGGTVEFALSELGQRYPHRSWFVVACLMVLLILGAKGLPWAVRIPALVGCTAALIWAFSKWFEPYEVKEWLWESWRFMKMTLPILVPAVLLIAFIARKVPLEWFATTAEGQKPFLFLGDNSLRATFLASVFGSVMYFPILTEIPFVKAFLKQGMGVAPAMAILLGGPGTSLPGAILIARFFGWKKMLVYEILEIGMNTLVAYSFGRLFGDYKCPCLTGAERHANLEWVSVASALIATAIVATVLIAWRRSKWSSVNA